MNHVGCNPSHKTHSKTSVGNIVYKLVVMVLTKCALSLSLSKVELFVIISKDWLIIACDRHGAPLYFVYLSLIEITLSSPSAKLGLFVVLHKWWSSWSVISSISHSLYKGADTPTWPNIWNTPTLPNVGTSKLVFISLLLTLPIDEVNPKYCWLCIASCTIVKWTS